MKIDYIKDLINKAVSWELQVPEFQREYVWDKEQEKLLLDSLYMNYTINSILIWEWWSELARRNVWDSIKNMSYPTNDNKHITYLLDWQQRTTTLTAIFSDKNIYKLKSTRPINYNLYIDIENFDENSENWIIDRLVFDDEKIEIQDVYIKLKDFNIEELYNKYWLKYIPIKSIYLDKIEKEILKFISNDDIRKYLTITWILKQKILDRKVNIIEQEWKLEQVLDVFERINTKNTKLNMFDIMVAKTYRKIWDNYFDLRNYINLIKSKKWLSTNNYFEELANLWENEVYKFADEKELLFIIMLLIQNEKIVKEREILKITTDELIDKCKTINKLFKKLIDELDNYKIQTWNYNKFKPIIKFISLYISYHKDLTHEKRVFISKWFWNTILYNRYSWAQNERIQKDFNELTLENYSNKLLKSRNRVFDDNEFLEAYYNKSSQLFTSLELLMINNWIKDFYSWFEVNKWTENNSKMELHHIFPDNSKIWKEIKKKDWNLINNIANLTPLTKETNNKFINNKNPSVYIKDFRKEIWDEKFNEYLKTHLISEDMVEMLENDDFDWFIKARTLLILDKINELTNF